MNKKAHNLEMKKQQYRKHLQRLSHIYDKDKLKKKVMTQFKSMDKLMSITHRLHDSTNKFKLKKMHQIQKESTVKDWSIINCSIVNKDNKKFIEIPAINCSNEKLKKQTKLIEKQNKNLFFRLMKVKPTLLFNHQQSKQNFRLTQRSQFLNNKLNRTQYDFSSILNSSMIKPPELKRISLRLHQHNQQLIKIRFSDEIKEILHSEKLYFIEFKNSKDKVIESECFSLKQILESQFCIFKLKEDQVKQIQIQELYHEMKAISKGKFLISHLDLNNNVSQQFLEFVYPNKKISAIGVVIEKKNLKRKAKTTNPKILKAQKNQGLQKQNSQPEGQKSQQQKTLVQGQINKYQ